MKDIKISNLTQNGDIHCMSNLKAMENGLLSSLILSFHSLFLLKPFLKSLTIRKAEKLKVTSWLLK